MRAKVDVLASAEGPANARNALDRTTASMSRLGFGIFISPTLESFRRYDPNC